MCCVLRSWYTGCISIRAGDVHFDTGRGLTGICIKCIQFPLLALMFLFGEIVIKDEKSYSI